jgi:hypothetical protein
VAEGMHEIRCATPANALKSGNTRDSRFHPEYFARLLRNAINALFLLNIAGILAKYKVLPIIALPGEIFGLIHPGNLWKSPTGRLLPVDLQ